MAFSTAGMRTRRRTLSFASMIMWARPRTLAAPPMSFFMRSIDADGLMSRPPVSKQTPFPTSVTLGSPGSPQREVDEPRGAGRGRRRADDVDQRKAVGERIACRHGDGGAVTSGEILRRERELRRAHGVGGRVDQVAGEVDRVGDADRPSTVGAVGDDQARAGIAVAVAGVAVRAEGEGERGEAVAGEAQAKAVVAGRKGGREPAGEERRTIVVLAEAEEDAADAALARRGEDRAGGGLEPRRLDEVSDAGALAVEKGVERIGRQRVDGDGVGSGVRSDQAVRHRTSIGLRRGIMPAAADGNNGKN